MLGWYNRPDAYVTLWEKDIYEKNLQKSANVAIEIYQNSFQLTNIMHIILYIVTTFWHLYVPVMLH